MLKNWVSIKLNAYVIRKFSWVIKFYRTLNYENAFNVIIRVTDIEKKLNNLDVLHKGFKYYNKNILILEFYMWHR